MPVQVSYPGVYIQEVPSSVHSIVGASRSATAFVDVFRRGPVNVPVRIDNVGDFDRVFGGVWEHSEASYGISQYFLNGGETAWVVRVQPEGAETARASDGLADLEAMNPGAWGNDIEVAREDVATSGEFHLVARKVDSSSGVRRIVRVEVHRNVTMSAGPRNLASVLAQESFLVRVAPKSAEPESSEPAAVEPAAVEPAAVEPAAVESQPVEVAPVEAAPVEPEPVQPNSAGPGITRVHVNNDPSQGTFIALVGGDDGLADGAAALLATLLPGDAGAQTGIYALQKMAPESYNLLSLPATPLVSDDAARRSIQAAAAKLCIDDRAFFLVDEPFEMDAHEFEDAQAGLSELGANSAVYFPSVTVVDPRQGNRPRTIAPSGTMAGVIARTDTARGIWKAPAGTDAVLRGATPSKVVTDAANGPLNELGINVLRSFPVYGSVCWGARTLAGADANTSEWKYVNVRRLALYIENSLATGMKWAVFEPNDEPLWGQLRLSIGTFMHDLFRQGAFAGSTVKDAYFVHCDRTTTTQSDIDNGIVNVVVGFAPLKPAEFVIISIQQIAQG